MRLDDFLQLNTTAVQDPAGSTEFSYGLQASYFAIGRTIRSLSDIDFDAPPDASETVSKLDVYRHRAEGWEGGPKDTFAARYEGFLNVTTPGEYTIYLTSDDGSALYLDGRQVIGNDGLHRTSEESVTLELDAGSHSLLVDYFENRGAQSLMLEWEGPDSGGARMTIGGESFSTAPLEFAAEENADAPQDDTVTGSDGNDTVDHDHSNDTTADSTAMSYGLQASYFAVGKTIRSLSDIDFDAPPDASETVSKLDVYRHRAEGWEGGPKDTFAARYEGFLNVTTPGEYTIYLTSDDGSALYLDGRQVIGNDGLHSPLEQSVTLELDAGSHELLLDYFENRGAQTVILEWQGPDSNGERMTIGDENLSTTPLAIGNGDVPDAPQDDTVTGSDGDDTVDHGHTDGGTGHMDDAGGSMNMGETGHGTESGMDHERHDHAAFDQPTTPEEENAFVEAVVNDADNGHMMHMDNETKAMEHGSLLDLVPRSEATHIAVRDGDWFDPGTWYEGRVPDAGAKVLIPKGVSVDYGAQSDASLFTVRVDGELSFATDADSRMLVDTLVVDTSGRLEIGTAQNPVQDGVNVEIVIANNGDIDVDWDPTLLSRGVISHGQVEIHGAEKTAYTKVADAPMAGDTEIRLYEIPDNWSVGDTIVLTGTHKSGWTWDRETSSKIHVESQDEEVTITAINGNTIKLDRALTYDHDTPRDDLSAYVANMSRNITFSSEDGEGSEIHHRGHVMFMHNDDVDVRYAAFDDLGRTDKSAPAFNVNSLEPDSIVADSNVQARYSFHFHRTGTEDQDNPAISFGNAVSGSPGWGYVHHSSHAEFVQNVAFDVFGAAFVAEDGDETGLWWENMAIKTEGVGYSHIRIKSGEDVRRDDLGKTGDGFWFGSRAVEAGHNIAANTTHGFTWMLRGTDAKPNVDQLDHPDAYYGREAPGKNGNIPIQSFHDNEAFGTQVGLIVIKSTKHQNHDVRTVMDGFTNWETSSGVQLTYTSHYTMKNFDLLATENEGKVWGPDTGFEFGPMVFDMAINGMNVEGFDIGLDLDQRIGKDWTGEDVDHLLIDVALSGNQTDMEGFNSDWHTIMSSDQLVEGRLDFQMTGDTTIGTQGSIVFDGIKTDSAGSRDRQFSDDVQDLNWGRHILPMLKRDGYYETEDGTHVMLINDYVADRATGELLKFAHVITLDITDDRLAFLGASNNGLIDLDSKAPVAKDDSFRTQTETPIVIDPLANDMDPEGESLEISGFTNPFHADLTLQDDGTLLYDPHENKVGIDSFDYWVADDDGVLSKATVVVDIFDM